jgi:long-chain acyl-CoA synthetase
MRFNLATILTETTLSAPDARAAYKYPREIRFMAELPKGPSGKILKSALRGAAR